MNDSTDPAEDRLREGRAALNRGAWEVAREAFEAARAGITANAVCPGYIATALGSGDEGKLLSEQFTALGRVGTTEDLVGVYHFLAADESRYLTGQALVVDGGWSCGPSPQILETLLGSPTVT